MGHTTLTLPTPAHTIDTKTIEPAVTPLVGRKSSFRGFSASSLSSLALGRGHRARNSIGTKKSLSFIMSNFKEHDSVSVQSRPPSLITDNSSFTSASSRSPSPEPTSVSKLEMAFKAYTVSQSTKLLSSVLLPVLSSKLSVEGRSASSKIDDLDDVDIDILFKWWNHLLLLATPCSATFQSIYAIAAHPALRATMFWNAHYDLTLSTTLSEPASVLPTHYFARLLSLGYLYHSPTAQTLKSLFADPTKVSATEAWVKRAKNVEVFVETSKHLFTLSPDLDDGGIIEARLQEMIHRVIHVSTYPNQRLVNLSRLLSDTKGSMRSRVEACLVRVAEQTEVFNCVADFYLLDFIAAFSISPTDFWLEVLRRIISTENHILQIRVFSFLYDSWDLLSTSSKTLDLLTSPTQWYYFFTHWSGIVRDHYMRLLSFKVCVTHPQCVRDLLLRSFETSLLENCQLRDCLPGNPIPNKRFVIRPMTPPKPSSPKLPPIELEDGAEATDLGDLGPSKKKLSLFRGFLSENKDVSAPKVLLETPRTEGRVQLFKFVPEYVGKQWSLTSDQDAIKFLDSVMDAARDARLPAYASVESALETCFQPFPIDTGRKRLWTRSLSEWSTLIDETDRFWRSCGGRSLTSSGPRAMNSPKLEVDFPRWFVQRCTQVAGDGNEGTHPSSPPLTISDRIVSRHI